MRSDAITLNELTMTPLTVDADSAASATRAQNGFGQEDARKSGTCI